MTAVLQELFAALLAEPFDPEPLTRAMLQMDPAAGERIEKLHATLERLPQAARPSPTTRERDPR